MRRFALDPTDVPAVQAWLEDWAARGWYLASYGRTLVKLTPGEKNGRVRYRLQPVGAEGGEPDWDTRTAYQEMGWTYVCSTVVGRNLSGLATEFHIWRCDDPDAPELDTDQSLREEAYGELLRRKRRDVWLIAALIVLMAGLMLLLVWTRPREYLLDQNSSGTLLMLCFYTILCLHMLVRAVRLIRFTRRLRQEEPAPQRAPWGRARARVWAFQGLFVLILAVMVGYLFRSNDHRPFLPVSQYEEAVPYVSLAELGTPAEEEAEALDFHSIWGKSVWWTMEGGSESQSPPYCSAEYYSLRIPYMAENLEAQMLKRWSYAMDAGERPEQAAVLGADSAWYWRDGLKGWQYLLLHRGGQVLDVAYLGEADLLEHTDKYVEMLERFG